MALLNPSAVAHAMKAAWNFVRFAPLPPAQARVPLVSTRARPAALAPRLAARRRLAACFAAILAFGVCGASPAPAQHGGSKEYQIKAIFLFNFIQFAHWPDSAFPDASAPIKIGILGEDPFAGALETAVQGETLQGRPLAIHRSDHIRELLDCHVLFVSASDRTQVNAIVSAFSSRPVLTVGDMPDFARRGGVLNFYLENQKVRFEVNRAAAQRSGIKLSSQLLSLARIVGPDLQAPNP